ncbi:MAG: [NiFe]-hydrogenase assembly chaperone HybE [Motiliproteus sp.]|nr:[NiFe]-hydrogenase assembly chaperone HybE [Motiliproteus sp.]MCW9051763.1 [NiFe]-hydrogenase assembly chaperone HybE [Motiliproteus sp.]
MRRIPLVQQHYQQIFDEKMKDLPIINSALFVQAMGFRDFNGQLLGVVITPWFMNLMLLPVELEGWRDHQTGEQHFEPFPAGDFHFTHGWDPKMGAYATCSLFSPMDEFPDQATAERTAVRAMEQLFIKRETEVEAEPEVDSATDEQQQAASQSDSASDTPSQVSSKPKTKPEPDEEIDTRKRGLFGLFRGG